MFASPASATAATFWWNNATTGLWTNGALWSNASSGGTSGTAPTNDTTTDVVVFNTTGTNGAVVSQLSQSQSIGGITVNNTGATTIRSDSGSARLLTLGAAGITINAGAGAFTIGASGSMANVAIAGSQSWTNNSSNTFTASGSITSSIAGLQALSIAGSGNTTLSGILGNGSGTLALTKSGAGTLTMSAANTYSGTTNILGGSFTLNGAAGALQSTAAVNVSGNATLNLGDSTAGNGRADRINTAASLTLGGTAGAGSLAVVRGSTTANSQTLASLVVGAGGLSTISSSTSTGGAPTITFNGANPYQRPTAGGVVNVNTTNVAMAFGATAPSGAGNVAGTSAPILVGAFLSGSNFIASGTGAVATATYSTTWGDDVNLNLTANVSASSGSVNAIRFADDTTARTLTLQSSGTAVVASGMILSTGSAVGSSPSNGPTIAGGNITSGNGRDLIIYDNHATLDRRASTRPYGLRITSTITDNGLTPIAVTVSGPSQSVASAGSSQGEANTSKIFLAGTANSYSGGTFLNGGGIGVSTDRSLGAVPTSEGNNIFAMSGVAGLTNESGGSLALDARRWIVVNAGAGLSLLGGSWTIQGNISGGGNLYINDAAGTGVSQVTTITGTSTVSGTYSVTGILRANEGVGLSSAANLAIGDNSATPGGGYGVLETSGTFTRAPGAGAGQVQIGAGAYSGNSAGFGAYGGNLTLNFGNDLRTMTWGNAVGIAGSLGAQMWLQTPNATGTLTWQNPLDLNGAARTIRTDGNFPAVVSGAISGNASSSLTKTGTGTLVLSGTNSYGGKTIIQSGAFSVSTINNGGSNGNLGSNATVDLGATTTAATLIYTGTGETNNRVINLAGTTGGATLDQSGSGLLVFTGNLTATGAGSKVLTLQGSSAGTGELSGAIVNFDASNTTGVTKAGSGTWTLSGTSGYTGITTINGGVLSVTNLANGGSNSAIGASSNAVASLVIGAGTLRYTGGSVTTDRSFTLTASTTSTIDVSTAGSTLTFTGSTASNSGALTKAGAGTLALAGAAAYSGATAVNAGIFQIGNGGTSGGFSPSTAISVASGATLGFSRTDDYGGGFGNTISGAGGLLLSSGTVALSAANTLSGTTTISAGSLVLSNANALQNSVVAVRGGALGFDSSVTGNAFTIGALSGTGGVNLRNNAATPASIALTAGGNNASTTYAGVLSSSGTSNSSFTKAGSGVLTLDPGSGQSSSVGAFSVSAGGVILSSGTLNVTAANSLRVGGGTSPSFTLDGGQLVTSAGNPFIGGDFGGRGTFTLTSGTWTNTVGFISVSYGVTGNGSVLNVNGGLLDSPRLQLGQNSGTSTVNLTGGTVAVDSIFNTAAPTSLLNLNGGVLRAKSNQSAFIDLTSGSTSTVNVLGGGAIIDTNSYAIGITVPLLSGTANDGGLTKQGAGTLTLSSTNTYVGATTISAGTLAFDRVAALNSSSGISIAAGAGLTYTGGTTSFGKNITVSSGTGTVRNSGGGTLTLAGTLTKNGTVLRLTGGSFEVTGQIVGSSPKSDLLVDGTSTVTLLTVNTYNGPTFVNQSSNLIVGVNDAIPSGSIVTLGDATTTGTLTLGSNSDAIGGLAFGAGGGTLRMIASATGATAQLTAASGTMNLSGGTLDLTGSGTSAGLYRLLSAQSITNSFTNITGTTAAYQIVNTSTSIDYQQRAVLGTVSVTNPSVSIITGGSAAFTYTVANNALAGGASLTFTGTGLSSVAGSSLASADAAGTSSAVSGLVFTGTSIGSGQQGTFTVTAPSAFGTTTATGTVSVNVLNHSLASFGSSDTATLSLDLGTYDTASGWTSGSGSLGFSLWNIASGGFTNADTAGLALYDFVFTNGNDVFSTGLSNFANLASGTFNGYTATVSSPGSLAEGTYQGIYTLKFRDQQNLAGAANTRDLTLTMNMVVVPEPTAWILAGIGVAVAHTLRRRRSLADGR